MESRIFKFVVGTQKKEYNVHAAALSKLSKPLYTLLEGPHKEAHEMRVDWPDIDEKTFVRFIQWAYTKTYVTEKPYLVLDASSVGQSAASKANKTMPAEIDAAEQPHDSLVSITNIYRRTETDYCSNADCVYKGSHYGYETLIKCLVCRVFYQTKVCNSCASAFELCPRCNLLGTTKRDCCLNTKCFAFKKEPDHPIKMAFTCLRCQKVFRTQSCNDCTSAYSNCPSCIKPRTKIKRDDLVEEFLCWDMGNNDTFEIKPASVFAPRKNTEACKDYTGVFLCHAKLYVLGDMWDIPQLCRLSLHRLHKTLKDVTIYRSRLSDIATLAKYVFENTRPEDEIRDMLTLYYACIIEDASNHDGLKSLIDDIPDFAFGLISRMIGRLE